MKSPEPPIEYLWKWTYVDGLGAKMRPIEMGKPWIELPRNKPSEVGPIGADAKQ